MDQNSIFDTINSKVNIVDVVGRYVDLKRAGRSYTGLCPFHNENTPSFHVTEEKGIFKCFGCGEGGNAIAFISKIENIPYGQAARKLADISGLEPNLVASIRVDKAANRFEKEHALLKFVAEFYSYYLRHGVEKEVANAYLGQRGLTEEMVRDFQIGMAPSDGKMLLEALEANGYDFEVGLNAGILQQRDDGDYYSPFRGRIMFPICDEAGNVVAFSGRAFLDENEKAKYVNSPERPVFQKAKVLYNFHEAKKAAKQSEKIFIFEGFMDVIAAVKAGVDASVAMMGTALTPEHAQVIARHAKEVYLVFDGDNAGKEAVNKAIKPLLQAKLQIKVVPLDEGLDPDSFIKAHGKDAFLERIDGALGIIDYQYEITVAGVDLNRSDDVRACEAQLQKLGQFFGIKDELLWRFRRSKSGKAKKRRVESEPVAPHSTDKIEVTTTDVFVKVEEELLYYMMMDRGASEYVSSQKATSLLIHRKLEAAIAEYYLASPPLSMDEYLDTLGGNLAQTGRTIKKKRNYLPKVWNERVLDDYMKRIEENQKERISLERQKGLNARPIDEILAVMEEVQSQE